MLELAAITLGALLYLLARRDLPWALAVLAGVLPTYLVRINIAGLPSTLLEVFIIAVIAGALRHLHPRDLLAAFTTLPRLSKLGIGLLVLGSIMGIIAAPDHVGALGLWRAYILEPLLIFTVARAALTTDAAWRRVLWALGISAGVITIACILQTTTGAFIPAPWDIERRATGLFDFPNAVGLFTAPIVAALLTSVFARPKAEAISLRLVLPFFLLLAPLFSQTEAAFVAIPAALMLTLLISPAPRRTKLLGIGAAGIALACALVFSPTLSDKLLLRDWSGQSRRAQWHEAVLLLRDHPFTGAGMGAYPQAIAPYHDPRQFEIFQYPHNILLNIWSELGLLGLLGAVLLAAAVLRHTWRHRQDPLVLAAFAALSTMAIHGLVDVPFFKNDLAVLTALFFALLSAYRLPTEQTGRFTGNPGKSLQTPVSR